jgi:Spy/CpxP family protein refolding chaperone
MQKRLSAVEERLELSAEQQPAWESFKGKLEARMMTMQSKRQAMHAESNDGATVVDRLDARTAMMSEMLAGMSEFRTDLQEFYNVLTPEQQATVNEHFAKRSMRHGPF